MFLDKTASVERKTGDTPTQTWAATGNSYKCNIQPASAEATVMSGGEFAKTFVGFLPSGAAVQKGDRLRVGAQSYTIRGIEDFDWGLIPHLRITLIGE